MEWISNLFSPKRLELGHRSTSTSDGDEAETSEDDHYQAAQRQQPISMPTLRLVVRPLQQQQQQQPQLVERPHVTQIILRNDEYFQACHYAQMNQKSIALCYDRFAFHSPLMRYSGIKKFSAVPHLYGLEYLMKPGERPLLFQQSGEFPCIYLGGGGGTAVRPVDCSTFLVNRLLDYVYHYIIEFAYMGNQLDPRIPKSMHEQRQRYRARRMSIYDAHGSALHHDYVLYTNRTSAFFRACMALLSRNQLLSYDESVLDLIPLSFNLVSFLCGPFGNNESSSSIAQHATNYDQWVIVPLYFIDLWNALQQRHHHHDTTTPVSSCLPDKEEEPTTTATSTCPPHHEKNVSEQHDDEATGESAPTL